MTTQTLTRTALAAALLLAVQSLRLALPLPPLASTLFIGSLVNACLLLGAASGGWRGVLLLSWLAPLVAYLQQLLPLPLLIPLVAGGNAVYGGLYLCLRRRPPWLRLLLPAAGKVLALWGGSALLLSWLALPPGLRELTALLLSWPQLVTALAGGVLAQLVLRRLPAA